MQCRCSLNLTRSNRDGYVRAPWPHLQVSTVGQEDVDLCELTLGKCNLCNRVRVVADTSDSALDAATTVAITAGALIPVVLLAPGDPSTLSFWRLVLLIGAPFAAQLSGVVVVMLSGGWQLLKLHVTTYTCPLSLVSSQLVDTAAYAYHLGFLPILISLCMFLVLEGAWNFLSVAMKFEPPLRDYDEKSVEVTGALALAADGSNYLASFLHAVAGFSKGAFSTRRLHSLPSFEVPASRNVELLVAALFAKCVWSHRCSSSSSVQSWLQSSGLH